MITAITDESAGFTTIEPGELGGNFEEDIVYLSLSDVNITIDTSVYPLEEAIRDSLITVEEIFAYARLDARNEKIGKKIREGQLEKIPYMLVVGDRDMENKTVSPRNRAEGDMGAMSFEAFEAILKDVVESKAKK